uniref:F-box domain-containing protein n=1 Tax=Triticum urartu TaxID=4572 RepID=A0A8R7UW67_TRIUA
METAACDILRLPEELIAAIVSLTSPQDACRAAAVSRAFRVSMDSDAVWSCFLPGDLPRFVDTTERSLATLPSSKARFLRLSDEPTLLLGRVTVRTFLALAASLLLRRRTAGQVYRRQVLHAIGEGAEYFVAR